MLHNRNRMPRIHILTLDRTLVTDVHERLHGWPGMESIELMRPADGESDITVADIARLTMETMKSRVLLTVWRAGVPDDGVKWEICIHQLSAGVNTQSGEISSARNKRSLSTQSTANKALSE